MVGRNGAGREAQGAEGSAQKRKEWKCDASAEKGRRGKWEIVRET